MNDANLNDANSNFDNPNRDNRPFLRSIEEIRARARQHMEQGAVTPDYGCNPETAIRILNEALATEIVCVLRYKHHYYMAEGLQGKAAAAEFQEHASEEQEHADRIAIRIRQLGGNPDLNPANLLGRSHSEYEEGHSLVEMIEEDLFAERIAIESYRDIIRFFGDNDPTSRRLMEDILAKEEEHAEDLSGLLVNLGLQPLRKTESAA